MIYTKGKVLKKLKNEFDNNGYVTLRNFFGIGNHQIKMSAAIVNLKPINKKGGNCCIAGFAIAKPKPRSNGAHSANKISLTFIFPSF